MTSGAKPTGSSRKTHDSHRPITRKPSSVGQLSRHFGECVAQNVANDTLAVHLGIPQVNDEVAK